MLKADPHIKSRIKILKSKWACVHEMITGPNTSGVGYDDLRKCVTANKHVWEAYLKSHRKHKKFKERPFPFYKELSLIFARDRANGKDAETVADVVENLDKFAEGKCGSKNEDFDYEGECSSEVSSKKKGRGTIILNLP